jgi:hypothetical protein
MALLSLAFIIPFKTVSLISIKWQVLIFYHSIISKSFIVICEDAKIK